MNSQEFNADMKAKLAAAGYSEKEMEHGALMAEMHAAMKLIGNPFAAMAVSNSFAKVMVHLTDLEKTNPERVCAASDLIFETVMSYAKDKLAALQGQQSGEQPGRRTVMTADLDASPAIDPKDIN